MEDYSPTDAINKAIDAKQTVQSQHLAAVQLSASLDEEVWELNDQLSTVLKTLQKSEKRLPHEIDLLKTDINSFNEQQSEKLASVSDLAQSTRQSPVFEELARLQEVKQRILSVIELLEESQQNVQPSSAERAQQLAAVFAGTPDESKWAQKGTSYYEFLNKII